MARDEGFILDYSGSITAAEGGSYGYIHWGTECSFYDKTGHCPHCDRNAHIVLDEHRVEEPEENDDPCFRDSYGCRVWSCSFCGWWEMEDSYASGHDSIDPPRFEHTLRCGILRKFRIDDPSVPLEIIRRELGRNWSRVHHISPAKMEELVGAMLEAEWGPCEVLYCGGPKDQGVDLIAIRGEEELAVQVKRRGSPDSVERVQAVRGFLGACLLKGMQHLVFVSTADRFSGTRYGAGAAAQRAVDRGLVTSFELIDRRRLFDMFELIRPPEDEMWRPYINQRFR